VSLAAAAGLLFGILLVGQAVATLAG